MTIAIYPISANPPTWGHADIMFRAAQKFENVYWCLAKNTNKQQFFSNKKKLEMMQIYLKYYQIDNVEIVQITGSVMRFAMKKQADFLIRGLRNVNDFMNEIDLSIGNRGICKEIETICLFTKPHYACISSSLVRELALIGESIDQYVHPQVAKLIKTCLGKI